MLLAGGLEDVLTVMVALHGRVVSVPQCLRGSMAKWMSRFASASKRMQNAKEIIMRTPQNVCCS